MVIFAVFEYGVSGKRKTKYVNWPTGRRDCSIYHPFVVGGYKSAKNGVGINPGAACLQMGVPTTKRDGTDE